jgi:hypothetical protein
MPTTDELDVLLTTALQAVLAHLDPETPAPTERVAQSKAWQRLKGERGRKAVAEALGLDEAELPFLDAALRDVERADAESAPAGDPAARNAVLARLRLLSWLETVGQRMPALALSEEVDTLASEDLGRKQVRAVELIVRSLIAESYGDQEALLARLRDALSERVVSKWQKSADPGDILSGCSFSELASLFVSKEEFERYERLYEDTPFLTLLKQRRKTIQSFLDDIRRVRNVLAHNKKVTPIQLSLLDLYYEEIVAPIQAAHDHGETQVDPEQHLDVSKDEIEAYVADLHEDVAAVRDDLQELRQEVMSSLGAIQETTERIEEQTLRANQKLLWVAGGVIALIVLVVFLLRESDDTQRAVEETHETARRTEAVGERTAETVTSIEAGQERLAAATEKTAATSKETADAAKETAASARETAETTREIADAVKDTKEAVKENSAKVSEAAEKMGTASEDLGAAAEATKGAAESMEAASDKIVQTLEELRAGFSALTQTGGIIATPKRPQEYYHNARLYEQRGDYAKALQSYEAFFGFEELEFVDPHLRFQSFLKLQRGVAGAREVYYDLKKDSDNLAMAFAWNLLLEGEARAKALDAFLEAHPTFAPALYARSRDFSVARLGSQSMADKRREKELLRAFLAAKDESTFLRYYLDQEVAAEQIKDGEERMAALSTISDEVLKNPVQLSGMRSNQGWTVNITIADQVKEIFYRIGADGAFKSTGFLATPNVQTGLPMATPFVSMPGSMGKTTFFIRYVDLRDDVHGPYEIVFDPQVAMLAGTKSILEMTKYSWVAFSAPTGKVSLYFSALLSYRQALKKIYYGFDVETPTTEFPFKPADPDNPYEIREGPKDLMRDVPAGTRFVTVQVTYIDGTKSEIVKIKR